MGTSINCHSCGRILDTEQAFCGACGTPVLGASAANSGPFAGSSASWTRVPWSLGLLAVLATLSFFLDSPRSTGSDLDGLVERSRLETELRSLEDERDQALAAAREAERQKQDAERDARLLAIQQQDARLALESERQAQEEAALQEQLVELDRLRREAARPSETSDRTSQLTPVPEREPDGVLRLIVLPFADVYVEGALQARATSRFELTLPPGTYDLRLVNENRATVDTTFVIQPGDPTGVRVTLPPRNE